MKKNIVKEIIKVKAIVKATKDELSVIGIDEELIGKEVDVFDIDKYVGYNFMLCSLATYNNFDYMIPTDWLLIKK